MNPAFQVTSSTFEAVLSPRHLTRNLRQPVVSTGQLSVEDFVGLDNQILNGRDSLLPEAGIL